MVPLQYVQTFFLPIQFHRPIFSFFYFFGSTSFTGFQLISKIYFNPILTLPSQFKLVSTPIVSKICQKIGATSTFFLSIQMEPLFPVVCLLHCRVGQFFFSNSLSFKDFLINKQKKSSFQDIQLIFFQSILPIKAINLSLHLSLRYQLTVPLFQT